MIDGALVFRGGPLDGRTRPIVVDPPEVEMWLTAIEVEGKPVGHYRLVESDANPFWTQHWYEAV